MLTEDEIQARVNDIPPLPAAVMAVVEALNKDDTDYDSLGKKISQDPSLSSRTLAVANSPFYGMAGKVGSLKEAILVLGLHTLRNIVLAAGIMEQFPSNQGRHLNIEGLWQHSLGVGICAKVMAELIDLDPDTAFTAGLLHDLGKMVLDYHFTEEYAKAIAYRDQKHVTLLTAEREVLGIDHCLVGAILAQKWCLPDMMIETIRNHHAPNGCSQLTLLVHFADGIARALELGDAGDGLMPELDTQCLENTGLETVDLRNHLSTMENYYHNSVDAFS